MGGGGYCRSWWWVREITLHGYCWAISCGVAWWQIYVEARRVLSRTGLECNELEALYIKDQTLTNESAVKVVGWALSHHLMRDAQADGDTRLVLSSESIQYGIGILQAIQSESKSLKKSLKDVVTENEFEKKLLADVIPPSDIGVTFDDIGALESVKDTLKELVMLPLQRPELFGKGQLTKVRWLEGDLWGRLPPLRCEMALEYPEMREVIAGTVLAESVDGS
ncbi:hypothetical protein U1Q18_027235 [Sarracenia purpurea var. burkii]